MRAGKRYVTLKMPRKAKQNNGASLSDPESMLHTLQILPTDLPGPKRLYTSIYPISAAVGILLSLENTQWFADLKFLGFLTFGLLAATIIAALLCPKRILNQKLVQVCFVISYGSITALTLCFSSFYSYHTPMPSFVREQASLLTTGIVIFPEGRLPPGSYELRVFSEFEHIEKIVYQHRVHSFEKTFPVVLKHEQWRQATKVELADLTGAVKYSRFVNLSEEELRDRSFPLSLIE